MRKIPTLFVRDEASNRKHVRDEVTPGCEWVLAGEGVPTRKYDGSCVLVRDGHLLKRQEIGAGATPPAGFEAVHVDGITGKNMGWVPVGDGPEDKWHREAWSNHGDGADLSDGTYELVGPKVQGNPERYESHRLVRHDYAEVLADSPRTFDGLRAWLVAHDFEGIVWHHPDGRRAKLKKRDFPRGAAG